jgi:hypothetical protein
VPVSGAKTRLEGNGKTVACSVHAMTPAQLQGLVFWLYNAIAVGVIAWLIWRRWQMRFSAATAVEDALSKMFKRTPEGWTFDSPYPRIFSWRRWTYLLTDVQKERLAERMRRGLRTTYLVTIGLCFLLAIPLAFWIRKLPDFLRSFVAGSPGAWLLLCVVFVLVSGTLPATGVFITQKRFVHPVLRDARRIGPAGPLVPIRLMAETTSARSLTGRLILVTLALLACWLSASVAAYLSRSLDDELLLTLDVLFGLAALGMAVLFGLAALWYVTVLVVKLKARVAARRAVGL